ncbi:MAG TPA: tetraacyldisaccharide 4'-kinase [Stellaceae bacterium]|nr:tetraacyldisaccharide 4'-kinase [Stellaceae bacterium]
MPAPEFWARPGLAAQLLEPFAWAHEAAGAARRAWVRPVRVGIPVLCVGNLVAGGAGKTPVVLALARLLAARGAKPHILSRGYGGAARGPLLVDPAHHSADEVGDEPLLLAREAPTWIARDRVAGAQRAQEAGAGVIVMDDGFQNPRLVKDLSLLVVDGVYGVGNGRVMPAGPLRESVPSALARADAVVLMGEDEAGIAPRLGAKPVLRARLAPVAATVPQGPVLAFAGIGRPEKFFRTLEESGAALIARRSFPDHHRFAEAELARLESDAAKAGARVVTTAKDAVRLAPRWRERVMVLEVEVEWPDEAALLALLARAVDAAHG